LGSKRPACGPAVARPTFGLSHIGLAHRDMPERDRPLMSAPVLDLIAKLGRRPSRSAREAAAAQSARRIEQASTLTLDELV
jgi:hypothetical protein